MKKIIISITMLSVLLLMATQCPPPTKDINVGGTYKGVYKKDSLTVQLQMELKQDSEKKVTGHVKAEGGAIGKFSLKVADVKGSLKGSILDCTVTINIPDEDAKKITSKTDNSGNPLSPQALTIVIAATKKGLEENVIPAIMKPGKKEIKVLDYGGQLKFKLNETTTIKFEKTVNPSPIKDEDEDEDEDEDFNEL